ncbi:pyocin knob domain-containing protein, partial [Paraclostridium sordellii]
YIPSSFVSSDSSISEKLENVDDSLLKLMFDFISHNHDKRYDLKNVGSVTDFNTALEPGRYYVFKEGTSIPNAPYNGNIYGALEVFNTNDTELMQRFTNVNGEVYTRLKNYSGNWWEWKKTPTVEDFEGKNDQSNGYQKFPNGTIIQWGSTLIRFDGYRAKGYLYYPIAFSEYAHCTGNVASNNYGGYCEATGSVVGDNLTRAYAEALDFESKNENGKDVRIQWIAIGR